MCKFDIAKQLENLKSETKEIEQTNTTMQIRTHKGCRLREQTSLAVTVESNRILENPIES